MPRQCGTTPSNATPRKSKLYSEAWLVLPAMTTDAQPCHRNCSGTLSSSVEPVVVYGCCTVSTMDWLPFLSHLYPAYCRLVLHGTMVLPWNRGTFFHGTSTVEVTVLPWYRNTINTAVLPHGTCHTAVIAIHHFNDYSLLTCSQSAPLDQPKRVTSRRD